MKYKKITVIVPVFDVEDYLAECVNSVIEQTYKNLEIILVDDGSKDSSLDICNDFAKKDKRVKVIHKKNKGVSSARNSALDISSGDFIVFVDGDDFIAKDMIELLYKNLIKNKCDISICSYVEYFGNTRKVESTNKTKFMSSFFGLESILYQCQISNSPWAKLYKKSLFDGIRFPEDVSVAEDLEVAYKVFSSAKNIIVSPSKKYYYRLRSGSAVNSQFNLKRMDSLVVLDRILLSSSAKQPKLVAAVENRSFMEAIFILSSMPLRKKKLKLEEKVCKNLIKKYRHNVINDKKSRLVYRIYALVSYLSCDSLIALYKLKSAFRRFSGVIK
jgi:glycosyltransferase involved in cell wall biosynthesis